MSGIGFIVGGLLALAGAMLIGIAVNDKVPDAWHVLAS
jgi:hypothetical protein